MQEDTLKRQMEYVLVMWQVKMRQKKLLWKYKIIVSTKMSEETEKRDSWITETGNFLNKDEKNSVNIYLDDRQADLEILQIIPDEVGEEEFTYYDLIVV